MTRSLLLGAVSAAALTISTGAFAVQPHFTGGGSTLAEFDYFKEFTLFNAGQKSTNPIFDNAGADNANDTLYWPAGSGAGQAAFLNDDLSCDANKVTGANSGGCNGGILETIYGASDATFTTAQISGWASSATGQAQAGNLIQLPSMGVGVSFPTVNSGVTSNGQVSLTDADLCGIFSGKITNWNQLANQTANKGHGIVNGPIQVVYRADGSGTSFLLINHLLGVCTAANTAPGVSFATPSTTFISIFGTNPVPSNFYGEKGSSGIANYISGLGTSNGNPTFTGSAISYLSPDFTTVDPNSDATLSNGAKSALVVAGAQQGANFVLPTVANITAGLAHPHKLNPNGPSAPPTTATQAAQTSAFVPLIETVNQGYPVIGYTTYDFAQCYTNKAIGNGIVTFLNDHYHAAAYLTIQNNNGFVAVSNSAAQKYLNSISTYILSRSSDTGTQIGSTMNCTGLKGR